MSCEHTLDTRTAVAEPQLDHSTRLVISELEDAIREIEITVTTLRQSSCDRWAAELEQCLADVRGTTSFTQRQALFKIGEFCHPKALGEANVTDSTWQAQLEALHDSCAKAFNRLEAVVANHFVPSAGPLSLGRSAE